MTAGLEEEMDRISEGELRRDGSWPTARSMLEQAWKLLDGHIADIRDRIKSGVREDLTLGVCKNCGGQLRVLRGKTGKRFAACVGKEGEEPKVPEGAPEGERPRRGCGQTFPLPQRGTIIAHGQAVRRVRLAGDQGGRRRRPRASVGAVSRLDCPSKEKYKKRATERPGLAGRGFLVTLEGCDGCGKSTQAARSARASPPAACRWAGGRAGRLVREPGGTPAGEAIRDVLLHRATRWRPGPRPCSTPPPAPSSSTDVVLPVARAPGASSCSTATSTRRSPTRASPAAWASTRCWPSTSPRTGGLLPDLTLVLEVDPVRAAAPRRRAARPHRGRGPRVAAARGGRLRRARAALSRARRALDGGFRDVERSPPTSRRPR